MLSACRFLKRSQRGMLWQLKLSGCSSKAVPLAGYEVTLRYLNGIPSRVPADSIACSDKEVPRVGDGASSRVSANDIASSGKEVPGVEDGASSRVPADSIACSGKEVPGVGDGASSRVSANRIACPSKEVPRSGEGGLPRVSANGINVVVCSSQRQLDSDDGNGDRSEGSNAL